MHPLNSHCHQSVFETILNHYLATSLYFNYSNNLNVYSSHISKPIISYIYIYIATIKSHVIMFHHISPVKSLISWFVMIFSGSVSPCGSHPKGKVNGFNEPGPVKLFKKLKFDDHTTNDRCTCHKGYLHISGQDTWNTIGFIDQNHPTS